MNLFFLLCFSFPFFLNSKIKCIYSYSFTTESSCFKNVWKKLKGLFVDKEVEKERNIITYNFIKHNSYSSSRYRSSDYRSSDFSSSEYSSNDYRSSDYRSSDSHNEKYYLDGKGKWGRIGFEVRHVNRLIYINNFKTYILSAYIPYIYMSVRDIYIVLKKIKELNFNTVYTFLFWPENEYLEDHYDISNSKLFYLLNFCASNGLFVILDIGPFINNIYNSNIPPYVLFNKKVNDYINNIYIKKRKKKIKEYFPCNLWKERTKLSLNDFLNNMKRQNLERVIDKKKILYSKGEYSYNNIYSLYYFQRVIKWFNYILPKLKKYTNINNGPVIYINIDKTFDNYYMYIIIDLKRKGYFQNICNLENYYNNSESSSTSSHSSTSSYSSTSSISPSSLLTCVVNFFKRIRRSYILTVGYFLYVRFNRYIRAINEYELGLIYVNEINKLVQKHFSKINILTTNYPYIKDDFINSYAGNNCYNHFLNNNWFDNECIKLNKPCIWSQVWTGAKYSIHNVNSINTFRTKFTDPTTYELAAWSSMEAPSSVDTLDPISSRVVSESTNERDKHVKPDGGKVQSEEKKVSEPFNTLCKDDKERKRPMDVINNHTDGVQIESEEREEEEEEEGVHADSDSNGQEGHKTDNKREKVISNKSGKVGNVDKVGEISVGLKKAKSSYNNYIGHIRNFKDLTFNILIFLAKGGVFINIFPFYSGSNINNTHIYLEHYSKETGQPLDVYFNQKEPLYSHIKKIFKFLYKYGHYLLKYEHYVSHIKISANIEMYDYDVIKIICNHNIKGSSFVKIGHINYNINSFSCIIYNEYKKKVIYDTSFNYNYEFSYINKKESYAPIDKYLYSFDVVNAGPLMCLREEDEHENEKEDDDNEGKKKKKKKKIMEKLV
ncbi:hypothetical protein MKS88_004076 [Plasmodium brasilianum]|uniref:Uncharacterized protein n=1 Tax=Plasmodium brasilianum TaxID=5824 RepID=A0ACB9Y535_PLABR|nr:hypothetical protein MKS88_004076 [Plasmodium brasilianum]